MQNRDFFRGFIPQYEVWNKALTSANRPLLAGHINDIVGKMNLENSIFPCLIAGCLRLSIHGHYAEWHRKADSLFPAFCCIIESRKGASI